MSSVARLRRWWWGGPWAACCALVVGCSDDGAAATGSVADGGWAIQTDLLSAGADLTGLGDSAAGTIPLCPASPVCSCSGAAEGATCNSGEPCAVASACQAGSCQVLSVRSCPSLGCQLGTCDPQSGQCVYHPTATGTPCDDGSACTVDGTCQPF